MGDASGEKKIVPLPALSWWSERVVPLLLALVTVAIVTAAQRVPGANGVLTALVIGIAVTTLVGVRHHHRVRRQLCPPDGARSVASLTSRLLAGGPVAPEERVLAGRIAWCRLSTAVNQDWSSLSLIAVGTASFIRDGQVVWNAWTVVVVVLSVVVLVVRCRDVPTSARWRRIALDPTLVDAPWST